VDGGGRRKLYTNVFQQLRDCSIEMCDNTDCIDDWHNTAFLAIIHNRDNEHELIKLLPSALFTWTNATG
jgi:hypothetical protein